MVLIRNKAARDKAGAAIQKELDELRPEAEKEQKLQNLAAENAAIAASGDGNGAGIWTGPVQTPAQDRIRELLATIPEREFFPGLRLADYSERLCDLEEIGAVAFLGKIPVVGCDCPQASKEANAAWYHLTDGDDLTTSEKKALRDSPLMETVRVLGGKYLKATELPKETVIPTDESKVGVCQCSRSERRQAGFKPGDSTCPICGGEVK